MNSNNNYWSKKEQKSIEAHAHTVEMAQEFEYEINDDIKNGGLNKYIVKPVNYCFYRIACFFGQKISLSVVFLTILVTMAGIFRAIGYFKIHIMTIFCFLLALLFSLVLRFALYFCIGMTGFWASEISRVFPAIGIILTVISGGVFPVDILGDKMSGVFSFLPFKYLTQYPIDVITGKETNGTLGLAFAIQIFWILFFGVLAQLLWEKGLKRYIAVGG